MPGPLDGVRVIDLTTVVMGPYATRLLGDLGAEVIKIEPPKGDGTRRLGAARHAGMGAYFLNLNRNKKSVVLDLKQSAALAAAHRLIQGADVLVSNVRPRALQRLGLDHASLAPAHPRLIHVSLVGYGQDGPYAPRPAYDDLMQGATGIAWLHATASGEAPRYAPFNVADRTVGMAAVNAIAAALYAREKSGRGQAIEVPMFETMTDFILVEHLGGLSFRPQTGPVGYSRTLERARRPYRTADSFIAVQIYTDQHWRDFWVMAGETGRYDHDPRFADLGARTAAVAEINAILADIFPRKTTAEWLALLNGADIPATPMNDIAGLVRDAHHAATGFFEPVEHPSEGPLLNLRVPSRWSATQPELRRLAPRLGEHTEEVLREAGLDETAIAQVVGAVPRSPVPD